MPFELPALPYDYTALEPVIDEQTMRLHHDKHHATYVSKLNEALSVTPDLQSKTIEELLSDLSALPETVRTAVRNHGGGHYNHTLFWESMQGEGVTETQGALAEALTATFGSFDAFTQSFNDAGAKRFGSGWVWLVKDSSNKLSIVSTANQDSPLSDGLTPLLGNDVWEHAYYLTYQNRRPEYLTAWWQLVNWQVVSKRFEQK